MVEHQYMFILKTYESDCSIRVSQSFCNIYVSARNFHIILNEIHFTIKIMEHTYVYIVDTLVSPLNDG